MDDPTFEEALALLDGCLAAFHHANEGAWSNGVTDQSGCIDEGEVRTSDFFEKVRLFLERNYKKTHWSRPEHPMSRYI